MGYESWLPSMPQGVAAASRGSEREVGPRSGVVVRIPPIKKGRTRVARLSKRATPRKGIGEIAVYLWRRKRVGGKERGERKVEERR